MSDNQNANPEEKSITKSDNIWFLDKNAMEVDSFYSGTPIPVVSGEQT